MEDCCLSGEFQPLELITQTMPSLLPFAEIAGCRGVIFELGTAGGFEGELAVFHLEGAQRVMVAQHVDVVVPVRH